MLGKLSKTEKYFVKYMESFNNTRIVNAQITRKQFLFLHLYKNKVRPGVACFEFGGSGLVTPHMID